MFLQCRTRTKVGKTHIYYSVSESPRVSRDRVVQSSDPGAANFGN